MKIFSTHRRKIDANRRYRGPEFQNKIKNAANYKRAFYYNPAKWYKGLGGWFGARGALWRTIGVVAALAVVYFMIIASTLSVTNVTVSGNTTISTDSIVAGLNQSGNSRSFLIRRNNFFLMSEGRVNATLRAAIPEIKSVKIDRKWPRGIHLEVTERNPGFVIASANQYYLVDDEGIIVKPMSEPAGFLVVEDQLMEDFHPGEMLNTKLAPFVTSMARQWDQKISSPLARAKFPGKASAEVEFVTQMGWSARFDIGRPAAGQLENLNLLLTRQVPTRDLPRLVYVDLRLTKWAYYCFKATPCEQEALPEPEEGNTDEETK